MQFLFFAIFRGLFFAIGRRTRATGRGAPGLDAQPAAHCSTRLARTHHSFLGSFLAVSKRNFATKYAFFQVFRDLQNYLAKFSRILQNFAKNQWFSQKSAVFLQKSGDFAKNLQNFCQISGFLQKKMLIFAKTADFFQNFENFENLARKFCRSRKTWKNEYLVAILAVDTAENEPSKVWTEASKRYPTAPVISLALGTALILSLIHIWRCRRSTLCRSRWSPYH